MGGVSGRLAEATSRPRRPTRVSKPMPAPPLHQRHRGPALASARVGVAPRLAYGVREAPDAFFDLPERRGGEGQSQRALASAVAVEGRTRREGDPALDGPRQERGGVQPLGQLEQQREPALRLRPPPALAPAGAALGRRAYSRSARAWCRSSSRWRQKW